MNRRSNKTVGGQGEAATAAFLESQGYRVIDANVRPIRGMSRGEIDLIAWHGDILVFIEVKTRSRRHGEQGSPAEAVDYRKRRQLIALASAYLARYRLDDIQCRFDVVEVIEIAGGKAQLSILSDAFDAGDSH